MRLHNTKSWILLIVFLLSANLALAASSPVAMLQSVSNQMLAELNNTANRNDQALYRLVQRILLPHADLDLMSELVVDGYWATATPSQRAQFKRQFTYYITRTYSSALSSYTNERVRFFPIRGGVSGNRVQVNSVVDQSSGQSISVSYRLILTGGQWKVYDFSVEGVSMVDNYRSQFASVLRTQGFQGLLNTLESRNAGR
jgi:phospholipid transport system substrate-binding protein